MSEIKDYLFKIFNSTGFIDDDGNLVDGFYNKESINESYETLFRHGIFFSENNSKEYLIDYVYEIPELVDNIPEKGCIYFKIIDNFSSKSIEKLRGRIWNSGKVPVLWVIDREKIYIYDVYTNPIESNDEKQSLLAILDIAKDGIKIANEFHKSIFDSGEFWNRTGKNISANKKVDIILLDDLFHLEKILTSNTINSLDVKIAHALIGRSIFSAYLSDRDILVNHDHDTLCDLFENKEQLYTFFEWLKCTFNGDAFYICEDEKEIVDTIHLKIIKAFFEGAVIKNLIINENGIISYQKRIWPYKFDIIPIELISSIYEMFAHSGDSKGAKQKSIFYTKVPLVDLTISLIMDNIKENSKILDPACGSGVFLVDAFRRIAFKKKHRIGRGLTKDELEDILLNQIYGVDIDSGAIEVAAFSLYLTFFELLSNIDDYTELKLPKLIYHENENNEYPILFNQDICNIEHPFNKMEPFYTTKFDIILGNLPWTELNANAPRDPDDPLNGHQWIYEYVKKQGIPGNKPDQGIMLRTRDFSKKSSKLAFIVSSRILSQIKNDSLWLNEFMENNTIELILNLSDLAGEKPLFSGKDDSGRNKIPIMPASIVVYNINKPIEDSNIRYICPKWYPAISKRDNIIIYPQDDQYISMQVLKNDPYLWKIAFKGTYRDYYLIKKIKKHPSMKEILDDIGIKNNKIGRGYAIGKNNKKTSASTMINYPNLTVDDEFKYIIDVNKLSIFEDNIVERSRDIELYHAPLVILRRSLKYGLNVGISFNNVAFVNNYFGISFSDVDERYAQNFNILLNNKICLYISYMLGSEFGWHNHNVNDDRDWLIIPIPKSICELDNQVWKQIRKLGNELYLTKNDKNREKKENDIFILLCKIYGLNEYDIYTIEDTIKYKIRYQLLPKKTRQNELMIKDLPSIEDFREYATLICSQFNNILIHERKKLTYKLYKFNNNTKISIVSFEEHSINERINNEINEYEEIKYLLDNLSEKLHYDNNKIFENIHLQRYLKIYYNKEVHIIKPSEKKYWSKLAALNDIDEIIRDHMKNNFK